VQLSAPSVLVGPLWRARIGPTSKHSAGRPEEAPLGSGRAAICARASCVRRQPAGGRQSAEREPAGSLPMTSGGERQLLFNLSHNHTSNWKPALAPASPHSSATFAPSRAPKWPRGRGLANKQLDRRTAGKGAQLECSRVSGRHFRLQATRAHLSASRAACWRAGVWTSLCGILAPLAVCGPPSEQGPHTKAVRAD